MFNPFRPKTVRKPDSPAPEPTTPLPEPAADSLLPLVRLPPVVALPPIAPPPAPVAPPARPSLLVAAPVPPATGPLGSTMPLSTAAPTVLEQLVAKLPGLLFAGLTEVETGTLIRGRTPSDLLPAAAVARHHAELVRLKHLALKQAAPATMPEDLREILVTISDQLHLLRLVRQGQLLLSIVLDPHQVSLPIARMALNSAANVIG